MRRVLMVSDVRAFVWVAAVALLVLELAMLPAPAFAQGGGEVNQSIKQEAKVEDGICTSVSQVAANQLNTGNQIASANANAAAGQYKETSQVAIAGANAANIANVLGVSVGQVNECLNGVAVKGKPPVKSATDGDVAAVTNTPHGKVITVTIPEQKVLADTGGMPLSGLAIIGLGLMAAGATLLRFGGWR